MLIQLYRENFIDTPQNSLESRIYTGNFDGTKAWFSTASLLDIKLSSDLTTLATASNNTFNDATEQSLKLTGFFRANKTGTYRFFTTSYGKSILEIDGNDLITNNDLTNQTQFANKALVAGNYYTFNLYYGIPPFAYPPTGIVNPTLNTNTIAGQPYGNGSYTASASSVGSGIAYNAIDKDTLTRWRCVTAYTGGEYTGIGGVFTTTATTSGDRLGEWLQVQLPSAIVLDSFYLRGREASTSIRPKGIVVLGSNNPANPWNILYESQDIGFTSNFEDTFFLSSSPPAYNYYRIVMTSVNSGTYGEIWELTLYDKPILSCGYLEPNDDGTTSGSTTTTDFITNATGLETYYDISPDDTLIVENSSAYPLLHLDSSLQGLYRISPLVLYYNRGAFSTGKGNILYIASDDLFNNNNGTYKNYIQLHEKPVYNDIEKKRFVEFSSDMSFECELEGKIEIVFRRGTTEPVQFRYALLVLDVERLSTANVPH